MTPCFAFACLLVFLVASTPAPSAAWTPNGAPVGPFASIQHTPVIATDGAGGAFIVWEDWRTGPNTRTFVQHLTLDGDLSSGWDPAGLALPSGGERDHPAVIADGSGGAYIVDDGTQRYATSTIGRCRAYHIDGAGMSAAGWPATGVEVSGEPHGISGGVHGDYLPALAIDGGGGVFAAWTFRDRLTDNVKAIRYGPGGSVAPGWHSYGEYAKPGFVTMQTPSAICEDGSGGILVAFEQGGYYVFAARFDASGALVPGWPVYVAPNTTLQAAPGIVSDGAGGAIVAWQDKRDGTTEHPYAQHLLGDGTTAPGWPTDGIALSSYATDAGIQRKANYDASVIRYTSIAAADGGGAFVAWTDLRSGSGDVYAQRIAGGGSIAAGWPVDGLAIAAAIDDQSRPTLALDGAGGVFVAWQDRRSGSDYDVYAQHVRGDASLEMGWVANGNAVSVFAGDQTTPVIVKSTSERAVVGWVDGRDVDPNIYAGAADPVGAPTATLASLSEAVAAPGWIRIAWRLGGDAVASVSLHRRAEGSGWSEIGRLVPDGGGRVAFEDRAVVAGGRYGYRLGWIVSGASAFSSEAWVDVPGTELALLGTSPNPASDRLRVSFSLRTAGPATITLIDIAGRAVVEREVGSLGLGRHSVELGALSAVPPGVYMVRLAQAGEARNARICVTR